MPAPTPDPATRAPSSPLQGAIQQVVRLAVAAPLAWLAAHNVSVSPELELQLTAALSVAAAAGLAWLGKKARDKGWPLLGLL